MVTYFTDMIMHRQTQHMQYIDVIMTTMASQITSLTVVYSTFIQTQIKENIKAPRHWPLCGEITGTGEFPAQRASYAKNVSIWWRHHVTEKKRMTNWSLDITRVIWTSLCLESPETRLFIQQLVVWANKKATPKASHYWLVVRWPVTKGLVIWKAFPCHSWRHLRH